MVNAVPLVTAVTVGGMVDAKYRLPALTTSTIGIPTSKPVVSVQITVPLPTVVLQPVRDFANIVRLMLGLMPVAEVAVASV